MEKFKILSYEGYGEDSQGDENVYVDDISVEYGQNGDCTESDKYQSLYVRTRNNGIGRFMSISTDNKNWWSFDDIDSFVKILKDFKKRASL